MSYWYHIESLNPFDLNDYVLIATVSVALSVGGLCAVATAPTSTAIARVRGVGLGGEGGRLISVTCGGGGGGAGAVETIICIGEGSALAWFTPLAGTKNKHVFVFDQNAGGAAWSSAAQQASVDLTKMVLHCSVGAGSTNTSGGVGGTARIGTGFTRIQSTIYPGTTGQNGTVTSGGKGGNTSAPFLTSTTGGPGALLTVSTGPLNVGTGPGTGQGGSGTGTTGACASPGMVTIEWYKLNN